MVVDEGRRECDLVMKGGITSGIVYPKAVLALKDTYTFRNIGGTSAGAIAAVATAAAEFGRDATDASGKDGFNRLDDLNARLCEQGFLRSLFQPSPETRALMEVASASMKAGGRTKPGRVLSKVAGTAAALVRGTPWAVLLGAGAGIGLGAGLSALDGGTAEAWRRKVFLGLYGALGGAAGGGAALLHKLFVAVPDNGFGICLGHGREDGPPVLIDWLIAQIAQIGGKPDGTPLTFGDLKSRPRPIILKMMTTNLSEELPYVLPFADSRFLFYAGDDANSTGDQDLRRKSLRRYFPASIVDHMVRTAPDPVAGMTLPPDFHFLPDADHLPIVVAMRMSLSFPILLSAVPLWSVAASGWAKINGEAPAPLTPPDLSANWFSDGGLSSNFPIQFFDSWLPTRPTFGIDLTPYPPAAFGPDGKLRMEKFSSPTPPGTSQGRAAARQAADPARPVYLPRANEPPPKIVNALPDLISFLGAIVSTMQNYRDNQLSQLPSYRERIVQVRLEKTEGGLNLDMPAETLARIAEKGTEAGRVLVDDFSLAEHQWTRFQVVMGQLEAELREIAARMNGTPAQFDVDWLLQEQKSAGFPYRKNNAAWEADVRAALAALEKLVRDWPLPPKPDEPRASQAPNQLFDRRRIKPSSNLRLSPQLYEPLPDGPAPPPGTLPSPVEVSG